MIENFGQIPRQLLDKPHPEQLECVTYQFPIVSRHSFGCAECAQVTGLLCNPDPPMYAPRGVGGGLGSPHHHAPHGNTTQHNTTQHNTTRRHECHSCTEMYRRNTWFVPDMQRRPENRQGPISPTTLMCFAPFQTHSAPVIMMSHSLHNQAFVTIDAARYWGVHTLKSKRLREDNPPFSLKLDYACVCVLAFFLGGSGGSYAAVLRAFLCWRFSVSPLPVRRVFAVALTVVLLGTGDTSTTVAAKTPSAVRRSGHRVPHVSPPVEQHQAAWTMWPG